MDRRRFIHGVTGLLALGAGCQTSTRMGPGTDHERSITRKLGVGSNAVLQVRNPNGPVTVTGAGGANMRIDGTISGPSQKSVDAVSVTASQSDGVVTVKSEYPDTDTYRTEVALEIQYPKNATVGRVRTNNGAITLRDVGGSPRLQSDDGSVTARRVGGFVAVETQNGSIRVRKPGGIGHLQTQNGEIRTDVPKIDGAATVKATNGSIDAALGSNLNARVRAETTNGSVTTHGLELADSNARNSVSGTIGTPSSELTLRTTNGAIDLRRLSS